MENPNVGLMSRLLLFGYNIVFFQKLSMGISEKTLHLSGETAKFSTYDARPVGDPVEPWCYVRAILFFFQHTWKFV